jgi:hypothetical protein
MIERRGAALHSDGDGHALTERVPIARRHAAFDDLDPVAGEHRHHRAGALRVLEIDLDAEIAEIALVDRNPGADRGRARHRADHDLLRFGAAGMLTR